MESQIEQQLEKIMPEDLARTFESAYYVFQGQHEHMDDLLRHGGALLRKAAQRFTATQMILGVAAIASVAIVLVQRAAANEQEGEAHDVSPRANKPQLAGVSAGAGANTGAKEGGQNKGANK